VSDSRTAEDWRAAPGRKFGARAATRGVVAAPLPVHVVGSQTRLKGRVTLTKRALLKRLGLRQSDLSAIGREVLGRYASTLSKMQVIDEWLEAHPPIDDEGRPVEVLKLYVDLLEHGESAASRVASGAGVQCGARTTRYRDILDARYGAGKDDE
jgi:hypothetical protein